MKKYLYIGYNHSDEKEDKEVEHCLMNLEMTTVILKKKDRKGVYNIKINYSSGGDDTYIGFSYNQVVEIITNCDVIYKFLNFEGLPIKYIKDEEDDDE